MTITEGMLATARRGAGALGGAAGAVAEFLRGRQRPDGGFADRSGRSDLYYTVFGLLACEAVGADFARGPAAGYLAGFGTGEHLDVLHLACLVRCLAVLEGRAVPAALAGAVGERFAACRAGDGGYALEPGRPAGSAYGCFVAVGALEDAGLAEPDADGIAASLAALACGDGSYANDRDLPVGSVPATAAAAVVLAALGRSVPGATTAWLLARHAAGGGFPAVPGAPEADLLSTATALHALRLLGADVSAVGGPCGRFVRSLRTGGGFAGSAGGDPPDCEYTFYALLALGALSE